MSRSHSNKPLSFPSFKQSPFIIPLDVTKSNPYSKQTYYGNWVAPLQDTVPTHWNAINEITRIRTYCSHKTNGKNPYESKTTTKFYQPHMIGNKGVGYINPLALREEKSYNKISVESRKSCVSEVDTYGKKVITRLDKVLPKLQKTDKQPITSSIITKKSNGILNGQNKIRINCIALF